MIYYQDNDILIRDLQKSDARIITDGEIAQGWDADIQKYEMRLKDQSDGKSVALAAEYQGRVQVMSTSIPILCGALLRIAVTRKLLILVCWKNTADTALAVN